MKLLLLGLLSTLVTYSYSQQLATHCERGGVCLSVNVPEASASSGNGDIFLQITGPSSLQYIAFGQGSQMANSNMFIIYADASGSNVTLSQRLGQGNFEPDPIDSPQATLLSGSGIAEGKMKANIQCSNCASWDDNNYLTSSSTQWIWAVRRGSLQSNSLSEQLPRHEGRGSFSLDLTTAKGGSSLNPFVSEATSTGSSDGPPSPIAESPGAYGGGAGDFAKRDKAIIAHGTIMGLAFALLFPSGAIIVRVFTFKNLVWVHAGVQLLSYILALTGMSLGIYVSIWPAQVSSDYIDTYHPVIGLVVVSLLAFQPILGLVHHYLFKKHHMRTFWSTAHIWFGRVVITLGIINGGLGLKLSGNSRQGEIAYGVIAGSLWVVWVSVVVLSYLSTRQAPSPQGGTVGETGDKLTGGYSPNRASIGTSPYSYPLEERDAGTRPK